MKKTKNREVTAFAPASVANVGCGFDFMGFAVGGVGDRATVGFSEEFNGIDICISGIYAPGLPVDPRKNTAGVAVNRLLDAMSYSGPGIRIRLEKNLPLGSGLGSSASSAAAAVFAVNELFGSPFPTGDLLPFVMESERVACGSAHADNAAPSLLGGFVIIRSNEPLDLIHVSCPDNLYGAVVHPHIELKTSDARRILRQDMPLNDVTRQCANVAAFVAALITSDLSLIGRSMNDLVAEPKRLMIIPGYADAKQAARESGALAFGISGSGPSVFALCDGIGSARLSGGAIQKSFMSSGLDSDLFITTMNAPGARIETIETNSL